jgi:hypothetical protein
MKSLLLPNKFITVLIIGLLTLQFITIKEAKAQIKQYSKEDALKKIKELLENAPFKMNSNNQFEKMTKNATYNFNSLVYITELSTKIGYHTDLFISIGKIASKANHEIPYLDQIAELIGMKTTETSGLVDLAKQADKAKTENELKKVKEEITKLKSQAEFKTIDEAIKSAQDKLKNK